MWGTHTTRQPSVTIEWTHISWLWPLLSGKSKNDSLQTTRILYVLLLHWTTSRQRTARIEIVPKFYELDKALIQAERLFSPISFRNTYCIGKNHVREQARRHFATFFRLCKILGVIPATSCSAERSFSCLRRLKTYARNTFGQNCLNCLKVLNVERAFTNRVMRNVDKIIDIFAQRKNRKSFSFWFSMHFPKNALW